MQHATPPSTTAPVAGIDWATDSNALCVVDRDGQVLRELVAAADAAGIRRLLGELDRHGVTQVAIGRPDGPVVAALLAAGKAVVVVAPRQVKHLRARYGQAGNKHDRFDAFVLADVLRTDHRRLPPLHPDAPTSLAFLARFPCADAAAWLTHRRLAAWLAANRYCGRTPTRALLARLTDAPAGPTGEHGQAAAATTLAYVQALTAIRAQVAALEARIAEQLALHPDRLVFQSLPRAGTVRAAKLLAEVGDARGRFPTADSLAAVAATARSASVGPPTTSSATPWSTSPPTAAAPAPGPRRSTSATAPPARPTSTPSGSWPAPGCGSSGAAGRTTPLQPRPARHRQAPAPPTGGLTQGYSQVRSTGLLTAAVSATHRGCERWRKPAL